MKSLESTRCSRARDWHFAQLLPLRALTAQPSGPTPRIPRAPAQLPRAHCGFVSSVEWLQGAFARKVRPSEVGDLDTARSLLSFFTEQRDRVPFRDMEEYFPDVGREPLCDAIRLGVQRAVFFLGLRRTNLDPSSACGRRRRAACAACRWVLALSRVASTSSSTTPSSWRT